MYDLNNNTKNKRAYALSRHTADVKNANVKYKLITNLILSSVIRSQPNNATGIYFIFIYKIN